MQGTWAWVFWSHSGFPLALVGSTWNPRLGLWKVAGFFFFFKLLSIPPAGRSPYIMEIQVVTENIGSPIYSISP